MSSNFNGAQMHGTQSQGPGTGRGASSNGQPLAQAPAHGGSQANLHAQGRTESGNSAAQLIEERIKHNNGEVSYR